VAHGLSDFEAKVVTARLGADGILWELRGIVDGMYPLGGIDVLVPVDELETARQCLLDGGAPPDEQAPVTVDAPLTSGDEPGPTAPAPVGARSSPARRWWVTAAVILGVAAFSATRVVAAIAWFGDRHGACSPSSGAAAEGLTVRCPP
jgi:hypothetical protein